MDRRLSQESSGDEVDLLVVGGGINGTGIARDAAGRGMTVCLVEQGDLAEATSSASTKLIHGGLRYLEYFDFRLVREALKERERLLRSAPHIIWPLRFVLPQDNAVRPAWLVRLGLFLYDHLGGPRSLPGSRAVRFASSPFGAALKRGIARGFVYSDAWVDDARLVVLNARDAADRGARIRTRTRLVAAARVDGFWQAQLEDLASGAITPIRARAIANAAGPWVADMLHGTLGVASGKQVRLVKGSHIVVRRAYEGEHAYILQNPDRRIVFAIPYEQNFTLIGTTDVAVEDVQGKPQISNEEMLYLCESVNRYVRDQVTPDDIVWSYSGVRPLFDDAAKNASAVTRDYVLDVDHGAGQAPVISVFGGKITTFRKLAEHALQKLVPAMGDAPASWRRAWTEDAVLPGGDIENADFETLLADIRQTAPFVPPALALRLCRAYGTRVRQILGPAQTMDDLGEDFGAGLTAAEIDFMVEEEWAQTAEDVLWRRSKCGLHVPRDSFARVETYLQTRQAQKIQKILV